jgi:hypothetical protein
LRRQLAVLEGAKQDAQLRTRVGFFAARASCKQRAVNEMSALAGGCAAHARASPASLHPHTHTPTHTHTPITPARPQEVRHAAAAARDEGARLLRQLRGERDALARDEQQLAEMRCG